MKPLTMEWVKKAEGDWVSAEREVMAQPDPNYDLVCFLAQQCAEKYLKARLQEGSVTFPRTHNLLDLLALAQPLEPSWAILHPSLYTLNDYAVVFRYPGRSAAKEDAREAVEECRVVREVARRSFGLPI